MNARASHQPLSFKRSTVVPAAAVHARHRFLRGLGCLAMVLAGCASGSSDSAEPSGDTGSTSGGGAGGKGGASSGSGGATTTGSGGAGGTSTGSGGATTTSSGGAGGASTGSGGATTTGSGGGSPSSSSSSGTGGSCDGVVCNMPPANICDAGDQALVVYSSSGTCDKGDCTYSSQVVPCSNGCANGQCLGDPCVGITCNQPPASVCQDAQYLTVYSANGTCAGGTCTYASAPSYCANGCANDVCNGDPCLGKTCNAPPANTCSSPTELLVHESPGTCSGGTCGYGQHTETCSFGCDAGSCKNDPCAGVSCKSPPADYCVGDAARKFAKTGTCSDGNCTYAPTDVACAHGCVNGVCTDCSTDTDCAGGKWCSGSACVACNNDNHCGSSCANCALSNKVCNAGGSACVECTVDSQCAAGSYCNGGTCSACNSTTKCGPTCSACSGATPVCGGAAVGCQCTADPESCASGTFCSSGSCAACGAAACGNGRCDCGETNATCSSDCTNACPVGLVIGGWTSGDDGWAWSPHNGDFTDFWRRYSGYMGGGNGTKFSSSYTQDLTYGANLELSSCGSATLSYSVTLSDDPSYGSDKSERLYVQCSGDGGASWTSLTPNPWPSNQSDCSTSYCNGGSNDRSFGWTVQSIALPAQCRTATARIRFQAKGQSAWNMMNPGWSLKNVKVN